jgi:hypothetical protein
MNKKGIERNNKENIEKIVSNTPNPQVKSNIPQLNNCGNINNVSIDNDNKMDPNIYN